jgi:alpha-tubulin suppressor-like RCC1 family protein
VKYAISRYALVCAMTVSVAACSDSATEPPMADSMEEVSGSGQDGVVGAALTSPLEIRVLDQRGSGMPGIQVAWEADGGGTLSPSSGTTDAQGRAQATWTLGPEAGDQAARASAVGAGSVEFSATASPGPAASVVVAQDTLAIDGIGEQATFTVVITDEFGNEVDTAVDLRWESLIPSIATVDGDGTVTSVGVGVTLVSVSLNGDSDVGVVLSRETIGQGGATVSAQDGQVTLAFPAGAVPDNTVIAVAPFDDDLPGAGEVPGSVYVFSPSGIQFDAPVAVAIGYDPARIPAGQAESRVRLQRFANGGWQHVAGSVLDAAEERVTGELTSFSIYGAGVGPAYVQVAAGSAHACGLDEHGQAFCWGSDSHGQLGVGGSDGSAEPVAVAGGLEFGTIHAGERNTCGLTTGGRVYCWGQNFRGSLGTGGTSDENVPTAVAGSHTFSDLAVAGWNACGRTSNGSVYCWGANHAGQIGADATHECAAGSSMVACNLAPTALDGDWSFSAIDVGLNYVCGLGAGGQAYCWGSNSFHQLGDGTNQSRDTPTPVGGNLAFSSIAAGVLHTCGLTADGEAYCWGRDWGWGNMGDGTLGGADRVEPVAVSGSHRFETLVLSKANNIVAHSCGLKADGSLYCWGPNDRGQLGTTSSPETCHWDPIGSFPCSSTPVQVDGDRDYTAAAINARFASAFTPGGELWTWGENAQGQYGDGTTSEGGPAASRVLFPWEATGEGGMAASFWPSSPAQAVPQ